MKEIKNSKQGFTLLELLVVVVIIGILAAIALPQYQLAIDKNDFAKMQEVASNIREAYRFYYLVQGKGTKDFNDLHLDFPPNSKISTFGNKYSCITLSDMYCCISDIGKGYSTNSVCGKNDFSFMVSEQLFTGSGQEEFKRRCYAKNNNNRAKRLCKSIATYQSSGEAFSPQGIQHGYNLYLLK